MRLFAVAISVFLFVGSQQQHKKTDPAQQSSQADQRGSANAPLVVKINPTAKTDEEATQDKKERDEKSMNDRNLVKFTEILALVGALQLIVFGYQAYKLMQTVESAGEQSQAMERHIGEAARSAIAMENIATVIQGGNAAVMRAYLSVVIGAALYQERQDDIKFEGKPNLVNTGSTPAKNVKIRIAAEIVPLARAENFDYPLPEEATKAPAVAAPHQTYILSAVVRNLVPDADVSEIKRGGNKGALTVWGTVTYDDIFGKSHTTKFAQWLFWYPNQTVYGHYIPGQNDMD